MPARAQDAILLQQTLQPDEAGLASVLIDRHRLLLVRTKKEKAPSMWSRSPSMRSRPSR